MVRHSFTVLAHLFSLRNCLRVNWLLKVQDAHFSLGPPVVPKPFWYMYNRASLYGSLSPLNDHRALPIHNVEDVRSIVAVRCFLLMLLLEIYDPYPESRGRVDDRLDLGVGNSF